jgi:hypothetical protein
MRTRKAGLTRVYVSGMAEKSRLTAEKFAAVAQKNAHETENERWRD